MPEIVPNTSPNKTVALDPGGAGADRCRGS